MIKDLENKIGKTTQRHCRRSEAIRKNSVILSVFSVVLCETKKLHRDTQRTHRVAQSKFIQNQKNQINHSSDN